MNTLFETALAATIKELDLAFTLKVEQKTALKAFVCKKDGFAVLPTGYGISLMISLSVSSAGSLAYGALDTVSPCILLIGHSVFQLRAVIFLNACLVPPLVVGHFHCSLPDPTAF